MANTKYKNEYAQIVYDLIAEKNYNDKRCIEELKISKKTFYEWLQEGHNNFKSDFSDSYKKAKDIKSIVHIDFIEEQTDKHITGYFVEEIDTYIKIDKNGDKTEYIRKRKKWVEGKPNVLIHDRKTVDPGRWNEHYQVKKLEVDSMKSGYNININFLNKLLDKDVNKVHLPLMNSTSKKIGLIGGSGSGKTHDIVRYFVKQLLQDERYNLLVLRHYSNTLIGSVYSEYLSFLNELNVVISSNKTDKFIVINFGDNRRNQVIKFMGVEDEISLEKVKGLKTEDGKDFNLCHAEEISEFDSNVFNLLGTRIRGTDNIELKIGFTTNPVRGNSWIKKQFIDSDSDYDIIRSTYKDNPNLTNDYVEYIESLKDVNEKLYRQYALGEFVSLGENIFEDGTYHKLDTISDDWSLICYGLDIGYASSKTAIVACYERYSHEKNRTEYLFEELFYRPVYVGNDIALACDELNLSKDIPLYCDSSPVDVQRILASEGYYAICTEKGSGSVLRGILELIYLSPYIHGENISKEFDNFEWDRDRQGNVIERPNPSCDDHLIDACRYAVSNYRRIYKK